MKRRQHLVVTIDGKPLCYGENFKYIQQYLDKYCGPNSRFLRFETTNSKYPNEYWGSFFYEEPTHDIFGTIETLEFKLYDIDFAASTREQKRDDDIDELLQ